MRLACLYISEGNQKNRKGKRHLTRYLTVRRTPKDKVWKVNKSLTETNPNPNVWYMWRQRYDTNTHDGWSETLAEVHLVKVMRVRGNPSSLWSWNTFGEMMHMRDGIGLPTCKPKMNIKLVPLTHGRSIHAACVVVMTGVIMGFRSTTWYACLVQFTPHDASNY